METKSFSVSECISEGWEYSKKHGLLMAVILFGLGIISQGFSSMFSFIGGVNPFDTQETTRQLGERMAQGDTQAMFDYFRMMSATSAGSWVGAILSSLVLVGLYNFALGIISGRFSSLEFDVFKMPLMVYVKYFAVSVITGILTGVGLLLCVIPGIYIGARLQFATIYIVDNPDADIIEALKASWEMTSGQVMSLIGFALACFGITIIGLLCCCVGIYFAEAVTIFATVCAYNVLKQA